MDAGMPRIPAIWTGPRRCFQRSRTIALTRCCGVRVGLWCGRELRSAIPAAPSARYRSAHFLAVRGETMNIFAAAEYVQPDSAPNSASLKRVLGVSRALVGDTEAAG